MFKKWKQARQLRFEESVKSILNKIKSDELQVKEALKSSSTPYCFKVKNESNEKQLVTVFGFNENHKKINFGNHDCILFTNTSGKSFESLFNTTATKPFIVDRIVIRSSNVENLKKIIVNANNESNGNGVEIPLNLSIMMDAYQYQPDILDIKFKMLIDSDTTLRFEIEGNSDLEIFLFPEAQFNPIRLLNQHFTNKRLSRNYGNPVTIETRCQCEKGKCEKEYKLNLLQKVKKFFIELKAKVKQKVSQLKNK